MKVFISGLSFLFLVGAVHAKTVVSCKDNVNSETEIHSVEYVETEAGVVKLIDFKPNSTARVLVAEYGSGYTCLIESEMEYRIPESEELDH